MVWNAHKAVIRGIIMKLSLLYKKKRTQRIDNLTSLIAQIETLHKTDPNPTRLAQLLSLRQELRTLLLNSFEQVQRKIRAASYSTSNKAGKKTHPHTKQTLTNPQDIANAFSDYYSDLYNINKDSSTPQPSHEDIDAFLQQITLPKLSDAQLAFLNEPFTEKEILPTIHSLPPGKTPGPDGLTGEYFQQYSSQLLPYLTQFCNNAASSSMLAKETLNAIVVTIPKPGKEPTSPQNFHPISLLNLDVRIYAKIIARRLLELMPDLIHLDQSGFTKGRHAPDATRHMINLIHHAESSGTPSQLLSLDAEKAFDRVHWLYLQKVLLKFGFKDHIYY